MRRYAKTIILFLLVFAFVFNISANLSYAHPYEEKEIHLQLTDEEKEYIDLQKQIKLAFLITRPPISFSDEGELLGINYDIMKWIQETTGLNFTYIQVPVGDNPVEYVIEGKADIAVGVFNYGDNTKNQNIMLTDTIFTSDIGLVAKKGAKIEMSEQIDVLVNKGYYMGYQFLVDSFPDYNVDYAESVEASLKAVQNGEADLAFQNVYVMNEYLKRPSYNDLTLFKSSLTQEKIACAVSIREDRVLVDIINKAISQMPEEFTRQLVVDYTITRMYYPSLGEYMKNNPMLFIAVFLVVICLFIVMVQIFKLKDRNEYIKIERILKEALEDEKEMYRIFTEDSNDIIFYIDWKTKRLHWPYYWESKYGYVPPEKFDIGNDTKPILEIVHEEDVPALHKILVTIENIESTVVENVRIKCGDEYRWYRLQIKRMMKNNELYRLLGKLTDIDNDVVRIKQLSDASMKDKLTGLYNKNAFYTLVNEIISKKDEKGALLFLDLDNFKSVNDKLGHLAGDEILIKVAESMRSIFRNEDVIARFGGDEFVVFVAGIDEKTVTGRIEQLRKEVVDIKKKCNAEDTGLSVCIGVSLYPADADNVENLVKCADRAMYNIKQNGKDGFAFYVNE